MVFTGSLPKIPVSESVPYTSVPAPRVSEDTDSTIAYQVCYVCTGNICRSPMGEVILKDLAQQRGLGDVLKISSAGTGDWHIGHSADPRTQDALVRKGYDSAGHRAQRFERSWFESLDLILALDTGHQRTLQQWAPSPHEAERIRILKGFDPHAGEDLSVADPYYSSDAAFDQVLEEIEIASERLIDLIDIALHQQ